MQKGKKVNFYDHEEGRRFDATVMEIVGAGPSKAKRLTLAVGDEVFTDVPHLRDAEEGEDFWLLKGKESAPAGWAD